MVDSTKMLSQQTLVRAGTLSNPLGLYNYESYIYSVPWNMVGWVAPIYSNIEVVKVNDVVTLILHAFNNNNSGAIGGQSITSGTYRLPKRFLPYLFTPSISLHCVISVVENALPMTGLVRISNNPSNPLDPNNGLITINKGIDFTNLNAHFFTSTVTYKTKYILNE
jgi:hypothetical protein